LLGLVPVGGYLPRDFDLAGLFAAGLAADCFAAGFAEALRFEVASVISLREPLNAQ
jgi:hypothetical protein